MQMRWLAVPVLMAIGSVALAASCPPLLEGQLPKLRAKESIDLCQRFAGTAIHCADGAGRQQGGGVINP